MSYWIKVVGGTVFSSGASVVGVVECDGKHYLYTAVSHECANGDDLKAACESWITWDLDKTGFIAKRLDFVAIWYELGDGFNRIQTMCSSVENQNSSSPIGYIDEASYDPKEDFAVGNYETVIVDIH